jgi:GAF domain-containing protein
MPSLPLAYAADPPSFRERTLARLVGHVQTLVPGGAVTFVTVDERRGRVERSAGWFAEAPLREAFDGLIEAVLERDKPLFLPRVDAWEAAPALLARAGVPIGAASVIACPVRTEIGRVLGALVVASLDEARPLSRSDLSAVEVVADLAALALERAALLEEEGRRAREELRLKRAAEATSASLELDEVYRRVVEHAAEVTGATRALLTRLNARAGELRTAASVDLSGGPPRGRLAIESDSFGRIARTRRPHLDPDGAGSLMHAPIELGPRLYGALTVAHDQPGRFGEHELDLLARLARSSAAAIANAIDFDRERRIARALTLGFVPQSLPALAG